MSASPQLLPSLAPNLTKQTPRNRKRRVSKSPKYQLFIQHYIETGNGTKAAIAAGYSPNSAGQAANKLLKKPQIVAALDAYALKQSELSGITQTYVLESVRAIADDPSAKNMDKLRAHELLGKYLKLWTDKVEVGLSDDLADRVARAREQATRALPEGDQ